MNPVERAIASINAEELRRRRTVRGKDLNDLIPVLDSYSAVGMAREFLGLLGEIMAACETLEQFDPREPQPYWYERAAGMHRRLGEHDEELDVLARWLMHWPASRERNDLARDRIKARYADVMDRHGL